MNKPIANELSEDSTRASRKPRIVRVVTASYVVPWHLHNTLRRMPRDFEVCIVGDGVSQYQNSYPDVKFVDIAINRKISMLSDGLALACMCRFFLSYKPDIVHSIMPKAGLLTALAGFICRVPVRIHTFTGQIWVAKEGSSRHFFYLMDRLINALNTICLTDSFSQSDFLQKHRLSNHGRPLPVLAQGSLSGVDISRFDPETLAESARQLREDLGLAGDLFVFSFIARKTREKGALDILKAFSILASRFKEARLLFVGPDEDGLITRLRETNPELFPSVIDVGYVSNHEVYLAITDVLCLPSYREGFGTIVIDAAAMGIPTIGSRIPGLTDAIADTQTGMLFPAGNLNELVKLMHSFIENHQMRRVMGERARKRVEESFTADHLYVALRDFYLKYESKFRLN